MILLVKVKVEESSNTIKIVWFCFVTMKGVSSGEEVKNLKELGKKNLNHVPLPFTCTHWPRGPGYTAQTHTAKPKATIQNTVHCAQDPLTVGLVDPGKPGKDSSLSLLGFHRTVVSDCMIDWVREFRWDCVMCSKPFLKANVEIECRCLLRQPLRHITRQIRLSSPWTWWMRINITKLNDSLIELFTIKYIGLEPLECDT